MSKAILISIKPKYVAKILNGEKTIEIRKTMPKDLPIDVYIYCPKDKEKLFQTWTNSGKYTSIKIDTPLSRNGKVVAKFTLNKVEEIMIAKTLGVPIRFTKTLPERDLCIASCLTPYDFKDYLQDKIGYAWDIEDLVIFDKPKELREFVVRGEYKCSKSGCPYFGTDECKYAGECLYEKKLTKAPQSWRYVEEN